MSEAPRRSDAENRLISVPAFQRWTDAGQPFGNELAYWREAEAELQAKAAIARRPIALPLTLTFTAEEINNFASGGPDHAGLRQVTWSS